VISLHGFNAYLEQVWIWFGISEMRSSRCTEIISNSEVIREIGNVSTKAAQRPHRPAGPRPIVPKRLPPLNHAR